MQSPSSGPGASGRPLPPGAAGTTQTPDFLRRPNSSGPSTRSSGSTSRVTPTRRSSSGNWTRSPRFFADSVNREIEKNDGHKKSIYWRRFFSSWWKKFGDFFVFGGKWRKKKKMNFLFFWRKIKKINSNRLWWILWTDRNRRSLQSSPLYLLFEYPRGNFRWNVSNGRLQFPKIIKVAGWAFLMYVQQCFEWQVWSSFIDEPKILL